MLHKIFCLALGLFLIGEQKDTIFSRVYCHTDSIYVDSKWIKDNKAIWNYKYTDPFLEFNSDLLNYGRRSIWAIFAVAILYGPPEFNSRNEFTEHADTGAQNSVYAQGVSDLKQMGINIRVEDYKTYLQNFKGDLLALGEPETREGVWIWYAPARRMIIYYHP